MGLYTVSVPNGTNSQENDNYRVDLIYVLEGVFAVLQVCTLTAGRSGLWGEDR